MLVREHNLRKLELLGGASDSVRATHAEALEFLLPLSLDYPNIEHWYRRKVIPGFYRGTRQIIRVERDGRLVGLGIAKNECGERKICTVRVSPAYFGRGIGVRLFDGLLRWLDFDQPCLTVSEERLPQFHKIFDYYGFKMTSSQLGLYTPRSVEVGYNEECL